jgi:hypothetical protein
MPFERVSIGRRHLSYLCRGSGSPTVIAEGGPGFSFSEVLARSKPIGWQIVFLQSTSSVGRAQSRVGSREPGRLVGVLSIDCYQC